LLVGCGESSSRPATYPVRGKVLYQGKPVSEASLAFLAPGAPSPAYGVTDSNGEFTLTTFKPGDGAVLGVHLVTVTQYGESDATPIAAEAGSAQDAAAAIEDAMKQTGQQLLAARKKGSSLPPKYATRQTSDLKVEVKPEDNVLVIELKD
jgi:hypothetical protein